MADLRITAHHDLSDALLDELVALEVRIFGAADAYDRARLRRRADGRRALLALVAHIGDSPAGYKIGYELTARVYYSWVGGVDPRFRRQGIARALMERQHAHARAQGYRVVRTHTENRFRDMLLLNIRAGFDVVGVTTRADRPGPIIQLEKTLQQD